jgi:hypothetical protein
MAIERTPLEEQQAKLDTVIERFRIARLRRLEKQQGLARWKRTEQAYRNAAVKAEPPARVN